MVNSQADILVPGWNELILPERAQQRLLHQVVGTVDLAAQRHGEGPQARHGREHGFAYAGVGLHSDGPLLARLVQLAQELDESVRCRLDQAGVIGAQLLADLRLDVGTEAGRGFSPFGCGRIRRQRRISWLAIPHFGPLPASSPHSAAHIPPRGTSWPNARSVKWFPGHETFLGWGRFRLSSPSMHRAWAGEMGTG